ncbi:MAG: hypothetical protein COV45_00315 [Deltaproteobacteria bacterium CG11_big_fil_rev_8_21_14_0_20_47_16]|nr:MAG: hypothetical protein COV45_00315 [Deltaproteobacteria bacterium CG11_big_fil_rev_8_21_14_0_20_47_16]
MADTASRRLLFTRIERTSSAFRLTQSFDTGCHQKEADPTPNKSRPACEVRTSVAEIPGRWVHSILRRFADGTSLDVYREASHEYPEGDKDIWMIAQLKLDAAWRISTSLLTVLQENKHRLSSGTMVFETAVGDVYATPHCNGSNLVDIAFSYPTHGIQINISDHFEIAPYEYSLCR